MLKIYSKKSWLEKFMHKNYEYYKKCAEKLSSNSCLEKLKSCISNFLKIENRGREKLSQKRKISRCPKSSAGRRPGARALIS